MSDGDEGSRPQALQGALQWLVHNTPDAVSQAAATLQPGAPAPAMSEERRQFLAGALAGLQRDYLAGVKVSSFAGSHVPLLLRLPGLWLVLVWRAVCCEGACVGTFVWDFCVGFGTF